MEQAINKFLQRLEKQEKKGFKDLATVLSQLPKPATRVRSLHVCGRGYDGGWFSPRQLYMAFKHCFSLPTCLAANYGCTEFIQNHASDHFPSFFALPSEVAMPLVIILNLSRLPFLRRLDTDRAQPKLDSCYYYRDESRNLTLECPARPGPTVTRAGRAVVNCLTSRLKVRLISKFPHNLLTPTEAQSAGPGSQSVTGGLAELRPQAGRVTLAPRFKVLSDV